MQVRVPRVTLQACITIAISLFCWSYTALVHASHLAPHLLPLAAGTSHTELSFSTGPLTEPTHWKQTVFYLKEAITCKAGEELTGTLACAPNASNPRDLVPALSISTSAYMIPVECAEILLVLTLTAQRAHTQAALRFAGLHNRV